MAATSAIVILISLALRSISGESIQVNVAQGTLEGQIATTVLNEKYYSFKGIPYAKPPVGELRFKAPQDPEPWEGVRNASAHGNVCPQVNALSGIYTPGSEDCMFLNVYSSNLTASFPVIVIIHVGAYKFGSGNDDIYGPDFLVTKDVVIVTFNYRLDSLGFLNMGTCDVPGNAGMKDQVAVLKWVKKNIQSFGGNPNSVTIMGTSAGGASVGYHLVSPMSKGLFHRAIAMSGAPTCDFNTAFKTERRAFLLGQTLGLETNNTTELLTFLQSQTPDKLINKTVEVMAHEQKTDVLFKMQPFPPVIEKKCSGERFLPDDPMALLNSKKVNKVDVMFSYNSEETLVALSLYLGGLLERYNRYPEMFVPSSILNKATPDTILTLADKIKKRYFGEKSVSVENLPNFISYSNNASLSYCMQQFFRKWTKVGSNTYFFKFSSFSNRNYYGKQATPYGFEAASHFDDLCYTGDPKSLNLTVTLDSVEYKMIQHITTAVSNFAKYGNPTPDSSLGVTWPKYNTKTLSYVNFAEDLTIESKPDEEDYKFWNSIFEDGLKGKGSCS
ncbi:esterase FE4-like [Anticarsia gemmatalis]|uniref:esterase FE4-like n=1 Tax=Anticarsia gemmatalis TaxID=129554 RepID=UPI003F76E613